MKTVTLDKVLTAIGKNGLPKNQHGYYEYDGYGDKPVKACAVGMAALNLKLSPHQIRYAFSDVGILYHDGLWPIMDAIVNENDTTNISFADLEKKYRGMLTKEQLATVEEIIA